MKILIADDDAVSRRVLEATLTKWGYTVATARDGAEAWAALKGAEPPEMAILDWMMPDTDGLEVCRRERGQKRTPPTYLILLTVRDSRADVVVGLEAGADDYITKPFDRSELRARVSVGVRMVELQRSLASRVSELEQALARVKLLHGLLPICSYCKKIRDDKNYWQQVDAYVAEHSEAQFSHSICPDCYEKVIKPELQKLPTPKDARP